MKQIQAFHRQFFQNSITGALLAEAGTGSIVAVNPRLCEFLGRTDADLVGQNLYKTGLYDNPEAARRALSLVVEHGSYVFPRVESLDAHGSGIASDITAHAVTIGKNLCAHFDVRDATGVAEFEQTRQIYLKRLEWSNKELQTFAHVASHDLQEPLRSIQAFGDRLAHKYADVLDAQGLDYLQRMRSSATRMRTLVNDLLAYSRVTSSARSMGPVDMNRVMKSVLDDLNPAIAEGSAVVEVEPLPVVVGDAPQLRQLLQNLVANSIKFRHPDRRCHIRISSLTSSNTPDLMPLSADIDVEDNGLGFSPKYSERIFEAFQRLHSQREFPGTGIGLAICRKIVELHNGSIEADGQEGVGAKFRIRLPLVSTP